MALIYRALWSAATDHVDRDLVSVREHFADWVGVEGMIADGAHELPAPPAKLSRRVSVRAVAGGVETVLVDQDAEHEWTTTCRAVGVDDPAAAEQSIWFWVDQEVQGDNPSVDLSIGRPRVVERFLQIGDRPVLKGSNLGAGLLEISTADQADLLIDHLDRPERAVPMVVFTEPADDADEARRIAERVRRRTEGIATAAVLAQAAQDRFRERLGRLGVWGGAARTYSAGQLDYSWRHRFVTRDRLGSGQVVNALVFQVAQASTRRRPPRWFDVFDQAAEDMTVETRSVVESLRQVAEQTEIDLEMEREEHAATETSLAAAIAHLDRLQSRLAEQNLHHLFWETEYRSDESEPDASDITDISSAVLFAQEQFADHLKIPDDAIRDVERLDAAPNSVAWGLATHRALRALHQYARTRAEGDYSGGFWAWCESGQQHVWPATSKKLSMSESDSVMNSAKLREARWMPVSPDVDPAGAVLMQAHIKISEGGGNLAPRIYFYDDTGGSTKSVHVGLIGPHYLVPNTRT